MSARINLSELAERESEQTEWKENVADIDDVVRTLVAFANDLQNLGGGYVVCGAGETKDAFGFPQLAKLGLPANRLKEVENKVLTRCRERVSPPIAPLLEELPGKDDAHRILVFVQPSTGSAHTCRSGDEGAKHWVRIGRATVEARNGILKDLLVRKGGLAPWDRRPCEGATADDIDLLSLRDGLVRLGIGGAPERFLSDTLSLSAFVPPMLVREPLTGVMRPRHFALLLFGRNTQRFVPGATAFFSRYDGLDRAAPRGERVELAGTLLDQLRVLMPHVDAEAQTLFDKHDAKASVVKYPLRALREAVINAFAHRDYTLLDPTRITAFRDRIEVSSPGALHHGVDADSLGAATAAPLWRNQSLAWFLMRLGYAEAEGQGLATIRASLLAAGCPKATFEASMARVQCILWAHPRATQ